MERFFIIGFGGIAVGKIKKSAGTCGSLPWEGGGRGFFAKLLRLISRGIIVRETPPFPAPRRESHWPRLLKESSEHPLL